MKRLCKLIGKILGFLVSALLTLAILTLLGLNVAKFVLYSDYYDIRTNLCKNPGLSDDFICQGICAYEEEDLILVSGYMKDHSASRIYVTNLNNESYYVTLESDGKAFTGHAGGIALFGDTVYLASDGALHLLSLRDILDAENGAAVTISSRVEVNNAASFVYADSSFVYVGEFHDGTNYVTDHPYQTPEGEYFAIVSRYTHTNLSAPDKIYSIRNKVQGICFTPDGQVVLSTSYGLADSVYYVYNEADATDSGLTLDGAPVYYLNNCVREIKGPAMAEGLDFYDGKVITLTESASNKYIFGKFFFANKIVSLDI